MTVFRALPVKHTHSAFARALFTPTLAETRRSLGDLHVFAGGRTAHEWLEALARKAPPQEESDEEGEDESHILLGRQLLLSSMDEESSHASSACETPVAEEEEEEEEEILPWVPAAPLPPLDGEHTWFYSVFFRVNGARVLFPRGKGVLFRKLARFREAHLKAVQYLDRLEDVSDRVVGAGINLLYVSLGETRYASDVNRRDIQCRFEEIQRKETPRAILERAFPHLVWDPARAPPSASSSRVDGGEWEPVSPAPPRETHTLYYGVLHVVNQCQELLEPYWEREEGGEIPDALWAYHASFVHFFEYALPRADDFYLMMPMGSERGRNGVMTVSDRATPWEACSAYFDDGAFHAGDLPDLYHVLAAMPFWGERQRPPYMLGKLYHKALPFACQRRHIFKALRECIEQNECVWKLFSRLTWVLLAGLYPGGASMRGTMRNLLHAKWLTDSKERLLEALSISSSSGGGPLIVATIFQAHILYMASFNPQYVAQAQRCVDWDNFTRETIYMSNLVRAHLSCTAEDPFRMVRVQLNKTVKSPNTRVNRLRTKSLEVTLAKHCNDHLEKRVFKVRQIAQRDILVVQSILDGELPLKEFLQTRVGAWAGRAEMEVVREAREALSRTLLYYEAITSAVHFKAGLFNLLLRMPASERMSLEAFALLRLAEYGGVKEETVRLMHELVRIYFDRAKPEHFRECISRFTGRDFMVVCFYFSSVALLDSISFVPLSADMVRATDESMLARRYRLFPGESVPDSLYDVKVSLCCNRICTFMGTGKYGGKKIAYDLERESFICVHGKHKEEESESDEEEDEEERMEDRDLTGLILRGDDDELDFNLSQLSTNNLIAVSKGGKIKRKSQAKEDAKILRSERKAWSKLPCGQPVLSFSLRGRALVWGTSLENRQMYLHCPRCGSLHMYTILNFAASESGTYRCTECARHELVHVAVHSCAFCGQSSPGQIGEHTRLTVLTLGRDPALPEYDPILVPEDMHQELYFCKQHYRIARHYCSGDRMVPKDELWALIRRKQLENTARLVQTNFRNK